jgi:hypothetical protein
MNEKIKYIEILLDKKTEIFLDKNHDILIHSTLNTIDLKKLIIFYLEKEDSNLKQSVESNILKRFEYVSNPETQYENLFILLKDAKYNTRQRIKNLQFALLKRLDIIHQKDFFEIYFSKSSYYYENTLALSMCKQFWDEKLSEVILKKYLKNEKDAYLKTILENNSISILIPFLKKIWNFEIPNFLRMEIIQKSVSNYFDSLTFLKKIDPEKYLYAMSISGKEFSDNEVLSISKKISEDKKYYALMSLGRLKKWNLIKPQIEEYIS